MKHLYAILVCVLCMPNIHAQQSTLLEQYRIMALDYNHDLKAAEKNISASIEVEKSARADMKPTLTGGASFQHTGNPLELGIDIPALGNPMTFRGRHRQYGASVTLLQPIYTGGSILESIRLAQHQHALASHQAEAFRSAVCYQTDMQYWNAVARHEIVGVATDFRDAIASLVQIIRQRVEVGLTDPQDLLMAEVKLNDAEYRLLQSKNYFETGRMALNSLIGLELHYPTEVDTHIPHVMMNDELPATEAGNRPEVKMVHEQINIAQSTMKLTTSRYKPQLYIGADGSYSSPGYDFNSDLDPNYAVYAKLSVPLFEWGKRRNDKRSATFKVNMATDNLNKVTDNVNLEIQTARVSLSQSMEQVRLTESSMEKAHENERKALERYAEGKVTVVEVIDAQTYRQTAELNYIQAKATAQASYSELIKALNAYEFQ